MTSDQQTLLDEIQTMDYGGNTYSNLGMLWGYRLISPEPPFTEGAAWDDNGWKKAVVMMTDGEMSPNNTYGGYWVANKTGVDSVSTMNSRLLEVCTALKNKGVTVYTVLFKHATSDISDATKAVYEQCASGPDYAYSDVTDAASLNSTFEEIAAALARLHISK